MEYRDLGKTGIRVSCIGLGCYPISGMAGGTNWSGINDNESIKTIKHAQTLGINLLDTAEGYGDGHSERIIGKSIRENRTEYVIATKLAAKPKVPGKNLESHIKKSCEGSLARLKTDYIDIYQLHSEPNYGDMPIIVDTLQVLVDEGKIRVFGISTYETEVIQALIKLGNLSIAQIGYSLLNPVGLKGLNFALENKLGTLIRVPLAQGALTGKYFKSLEELSNVDRRYQRFNTPRISASLKKLEELTFLSETPGRTLVQAALRFVLDTPGVTSVIAGAKDRTQLEENAGAAYDRSLTEAEKQKALKIGKEANWPLPPYTKWT